MAFPFDVGMSHVGTRANLVCKVDVFDSMHENHRLSMVPSGLKFVYRGLLDGSFALFTILGCLFTQQYPYPCFVMDDFTKVLEHSSPSWDSLHRVVELCSGMGALGHGALAMGFQPVVGNDMNPKMTEMFSRMSSIPSVTGDICQPDVIFEVWKQSSGAHTVAAGFSCQPFSALGDQRAQADERSQSLTSVLAAAFYLQCHILVLECVAPAGTNDWVQRELKHFCDVAGFVSTQVVLKLDDIWPCRRERWWRILSSQLIGSIPIEPWPELHCLPTIDHLIPLIHLWAQGDEESLTLTPDEMVAFGIHDGTYPKYMMNSKGKSPCALHAWGSQLSPCPCDCRSAGLSPHRLATRGLFGLLVRSAENAQGESHIRHVHPNEAMILNGVDPVLDYGPNVKLTLSAVGQLASPLQALWVFAAIAARLDTLQCGGPVQSPLAQLQAYRSWLVMRSRLVWPRKVDLISDSNLNALAAYWKPYSSLSLDELIHSTNWQDLWNFPISIGAILDLIIRKTAEAHASMEVTGPSKPLHDSTEDDDDELPTPWMETICTDPTATYPDVQCDESQVAVIFHGEPPVIFASPVGSTVHAFLTAHAALIGAPVIGQITLNGRVVDTDHVLQPAQTLVVHLQARGSHANDMPAEPRESGRLPIMPEGASLHDQGVSQPPVHPFVQPTVIDPAGPTATRTQKPESAASEPAVEFSSIGPGVDPKHDVTQAYSGVSHSLISVAPLLSLKDDQFAHLPVPHVRDPTQLWSLRSQFIESTDRAQVLMRQGHLLADDEIRFHLVQLQSEASQFRSSHHENPRLVSIVDPLLASGWIRDEGPSCQQWASEHTDIPAGKADLITAFQVDGHWIPVFVSKVGDNLVFETWDAPCSSHDRLSTILMRMSIGFGFPSPLISRHHRMFLNSSLCGTLAIGFLHHVLKGVMLLTTKEEAEHLHLVLREKFCHALQSCNVALRPWVWGAGDELDSSNPVPPVSSEADSGLISQYDRDASSLPLGHSCIPREDRIELFAAHGSAMGDDEARFHLGEIVRLSRESDQFATPDGIRFVMIEPLLFSCWATVGRFLCESWCRLQLLRRSAFQILTMICSEDHWIPVWMVPHASCLQCHLMCDDVALDAQLRPMLEIVAQGLGFASLVLHFIPPCVSTTEFCGALAVCFLKHVVLGCALPTTRDELHGFHVDFRAGFVEALYRGTTCICPTIWGNGPSKLVSDLAFELVKRGVPADRSEHRAQQAVKAIGAEAVQTALSEKQSWRRLKMLANQVKFQFIQPDELAANIAANKKNEVTKKMPVAKPPRVPQVPSEVVLDPTKLLVMPGIFVHQGRAMSQLSVQQIGPVSSGFVLMSMTEAEPYLRAGRLVSQEPLALVIFHGPGVSIQTTLAQYQAAIPCKCTVDNEPILADATVIQIGTGLIEKANHAAVELDSLDVVTVKVLVYRDELTIAWDDFISSPIRHLVTMFPMLKRCTEPNCNCGSWHNEQQLPVQDVLLDVWRRQFLRNGFKPEKASTSDIFSVCLRIPTCLLVQVLSLSGNQGAYVEPRTPDGREVLPDYVVIWMPKMTTLELQHLRQTNPAVTGLARVGEQKGLRVPSGQAQAVHALVRPDTLYLPVGPRKTFQVGPFPYGCDRQAISRAMKQAGWEVKPLQPATPVHGKGNVWLLQAVEEPPTSVILTSHGEVIISKHKDDDGSSKVTQSKPVGAATTLALCGGSNAFNRPEPDPWAKSDPWSGYKAPCDPAASASATDSMRQLETRLYDAIVEKLPTNVPMDDGVPDRLNMLERQVQQLMSKQQHLETNMAEYSQQHGQQMANLQTQLTTQGQQFHGQMETQAQSIAAMFENQMQQIRGLLSKRPHEATME